MPPQPQVPLWLQVILVVGSAMCAAALAYPDPAFVIPPVVKFVLFIGNVGLTTTVAVLTIKKPAE